MELTIRPARVEEADALAELHYAAWKVGYQDSMPEAVMQALDLEEFYPRWRYRLSPEGAGHRILVAEEGGKLVGFTTYGASREAMQIPSAYAEIYTLYVHPNVWGQGVGGRLMKSVFQQLIQEEIKGCFLWVLKSNTRARLFYEHLGMQLHPQERWISTHGVEVPVSCYVLAPIRQADAA
jgi:ribosomal protein S18 acetylase RimI-like enzyme